MPSSGQIGTHSRPPAGCHRLDAAAVSPGAAHQPGKGLVGQSLADEIGSTRRQADKWRSDGLRQLYNVAAVTAMAQGFEGAQPCPRFQRLVSRSGWQEGPLGERLCGRLIRHLAQCATCTATRNRLHKTLELFPAFILVLIPAGLLSREHPATRHEKSRDNGKHPGGGAAPPSPPNPGRPAAHSASKKRHTWTEGMAGAFAVLALLRGAVYLEHTHHLPGLTSAQTTLNVWVEDPSLSVYSTPAGLTCLSTCHGKFTGGTRVTLTSTYQTGSLPLNWVGCDTPTASAEESCTVTVSHDTAVCIVSSDPYQPDLMMTPAECARRAAQ